MRRESIAYVFLHILGAPDEEDWMGENGTVSKIQILLEIARGSRNTILKVLRDVDFCMVAGVPYDSSVDRTNVGHEPVIEDGSVELQILEIQRN
jgi:hypothetical protein